MCTFKGHEDTSVAIVALITARAGLPTEAVGPALAAVEHSVNANTATMAAVRASGLMSPPKR